MALHSRHQSRWWRFQRLNLQARSSHLQFVLSPLSAPARPQPLPTRPPCTGAVLARHKLTWHQTLQGSPLMLLPWPWQQRCQSAHRALPSSRQGRHHLHLQLPTQPPSLTGTTLSWRTQVHENRCCQSCCARRVHQVGAALTRPPSPLPRTTQSSRLHQPPPCSATPYLAAAASGWRPLPVPGWRWRAPPCRPPSSQPRRRRGRRMRRRCWRLRHLRWTSPHSR